VHILLTLTKKSKKMPENGVFSGFWRIADDLFGGLPSVALMTLWGQLGNRLS
jgi:hypothetical protein